jgi:hypothetical protein
MPGFKANYLSDKQLAMVFGAVTWTPPATLYCALFTVAPTAAGGGTEVTGGGYARVAVTNNITNFSVASQQATNLSAIDFGTPSAAWGTIVAGAWFDAASGGNMLYTGPFSPSRVGTSGLNFSIPVNGFIATEQ